MTTKAEYDRMLADLPKPGPPVDIDATLKKLDEILDVDKEKKRLQKALRKSKANAAQLLKELGAALSEAEALREEVAKAKARPPKIVQVNDPRVAAAEKRAVEAEKRAFRATSTAEREKSRADFAEARIAEVRAQAAGDIDHANRNAAAAEKRVADAEATAKDALDRAEKAHYEGYKKALDETKALAEYAERRIREAMRIEEVRDQ